MSKEKFDDATLKSLARNYYHAGCYDNGAVQVLNNANSVLTVTERNILVQFVEKYHQAIFKNAKSGLSMKQMRDGILKKAGAESLINSGCTYTGNINAIQLRAIYNYIMDIQELNEED